MHPPMSPLTERVRIEAEQNIFKREAEWNVQAIPVTTSLRHALDTFAVQIREMLQGIQSFYHSRRYSLDLAEESVEQRD